MKFAATLQCCVMGLLLSMAGSIQAQPANESVNASVRVGIYQNAPKVFVDENGNPSGFWVDLLDAIAQRENWQLEYVPCEWEQCLQAVEQGQLDLMVDVAYSEERDRRFDFNREVVFASWSELYVRSGETINSILDLDQRRIAVLDDSIQESFLRDQSQAFNITPEFVEVDDFHDMFQQVATGRVDAAIANHFFGVANAQRYGLETTNILVQPALIHFAAPETSSAERLAALDRVLQTMKANPDSPYYQAQQQWLEPDDTFTSADVRRMAWNLLIYVPLIGLVGFIVWNISLKKEIKRREQSEAALQESETRFQKLADNIPGAIYGYCQNPDGSDRFLYLSSGFRDIYGIEPEQVLQDSSYLWSCIHPDDLERFRETVAESHQTLTTWQCEHRIRTPEGQVKWVQGISRPTRQPDGTVVWDGLLIDVSDRKQTEVRMNEVRQRLELATQSARLGIWDLDLMENRLIWDDRMYELYGVSPEQFGGAYETWQQGIHPDDLQQADQAVKAAIANQDRLQTEFRVIWPDGQIRYIEAYAVIMRDADGTPTRMIGVNWDVSDRKRVELALLESEQRFQNMAANVPGAIFQYVLHPDRTSRVIYMSRGCYDLWEVDAAQVVENSQVLWEMVHPEDLPAMYESVLESARTLQPWFWQWRITTPSGNVKWLEAAGRPVRHDNGDVVWDTLIVDVSDRKRVELALQDSEERLRLVTENMSDLVCLHYPDGRYLYVTPSCQVLLGYSPNEMLGRDPYDFFHPDDRTYIYQESHRQALLGFPAPVTYRFRTKNGEYIWLETLTKPILDEQDNILHLQTTSRNVSDRVKAQKQLEHDALHDGLTGLPNRNLLMTRLDLALKRFRHNPNAKFSVLFLDLDNFKVINDSLGHLVGDELLLEVAGQLTKFLAETDVAARLGGDEFVILLEDIHDIETAVRLAEGILERMRSPFQVANRDVFISTSIGIVTGDDNHQQAQDLLRDADLAMYRAKQSGRNRYAIFDPDLHRQVLQRLHLEHDLRNAIKNQEFVLYYQPLVNLRNLKVRGFEALIRWQHPQRGLVSPDEFIPVVEETGLIIPLGRWILHAACRQLATWSAQYPELSLRISVNLSVQQLQASLLQHLDDALKNNGVEGHQLVLEITESMLIQNMEVTRPLLDQVRDRGIRLSIDDFGTGYSSLQYLHQLPVDALKIDRAFVSPSSTDARNQVIAESIVALSNLLELRAIAEGIETPQQLQWLQTLGCEMGQGYLFSPPLPAYQASALLNTPTYNRFLPSQVDPYHS